jgi:hypothetical protein
MVKDGRRRKPRNTNVLGINHTIHGGDQRVIAVQKSRDDRNELAVIRHFEPTRIERELLAQVFDIVSPRAIATVGRIERHEETTCKESTRQFVKGSLSCGVEQVGNLRRDQRERAA